MKTTAIAKIEKPTRNKENITGMLGTLLAFKLAEGILYAGHAVMKRASKRAESHLKRTHKGEKNYV